MSSRLLSFTLRQVSLKSQRFLCVASDLPFHASEGLEGCFAATSMNYEPLSRRHLILRVSSWFVLAIEESWGKVEVWSERLCEAREVISTV